MWWELWFELPPVAQPPPQPDPEYRGTFYLKWVKKGTPQPSQFGVALTWDTTTSFPVSASTAWTSPVTVTLPTLTPVTWPMPLTEAALALEIENRILDWGWGPPSDVIYEWQKEWKRCRRKEKRNRMERRKTDISITLHPPKSVKHLVIICLMAL